MPLLIAQTILDKLGNKTPPVSRSEVEQCFDNKAGRLLRDIREKHKTDPPTLWFIAKTNQNRELKIVFVQKGLDVHLKTAYEPNAEERYIYAKHALRGL